MFHAGRDHKELIPADRMSHPLHFQPSAALLAKYEYVLPGPVLAVTEMIFGIRIKADIGQIEIGCETVFPKLLDEKFRKHYDTLALEAFSQFQHRPCFLRNKGNRAESARSHRPGTARVLQIYSKKYMFFKKKSIFYLCRNRLLCEK
ncbi:MAG: hypothetical protein V8Q54_05900 [Alistipes senegalensis]